MDSLIHYRTPDMVTMIASLVAMADRSIVFTFAPRTPLLTVMHTVGLLFPKSDRAPAIEPVDTGELRRQILAHPDLANWQPQPTQRIDSGFYMSEAMEVRRG